MSVYTNLTSYKKYEKFSYLKIFHLSLVSWTPVVISLTFEYLCEFS
jgi:hypothetical protein